MANYRFCVGSPAARPMYPSTGLMLNAAALEFNVGSGMSRLTSHNTLALVSYNQEQLSIPGHP